MKLIKFILILILTLLVYLLKKKELFNNNKPKIGVYTYNFGNFRNELKKNSIDRFKKDNRLDYYFYTDQDNIKSKKWNIIKVPLQKRTKHMNTNRVTAKYYKWKIIPKELKKYDYILHIDCARIQYLNKVKYEDLINLIEKNPNVLFFGRKHPFLLNIYDECEYVKNQTKLDNNQNINKWINELNNKKFKQKFTHIETCFFLKKNVKRLNKILPNVFDKLMETELCRDQHVFLYVLQKQGLKQGELLIYNKFF